VDALVAKHAGRVVAYDKLDDAKAGLAEPMPPLRLLSFATPAEATREFVAGVPQAHPAGSTDDPYTDVIWGILTGYDAANALRIAKQYRAIGNQAVGPSPAPRFALSTCPSGVWFLRIRSGAGRAQRSR